MGNFVVGIISLSIGVVVLANVFIYSTRNISSTSGCINRWNGTECLGHSLSSAELALWGLIALVGIGGMIYGVMNVFGMS